MTKPVGDVASAGTGGTDFAGFLISKSVEINGFSGARAGCSEARIPLAEAVILLATAPKSNSAILAIDEALSDVRQGKAFTIPASIQDSHYEGAASFGRGEGYKYSHNYPNHYIKQQFLPDELKDRIYYRFGDNKVENAGKQYWSKIKNND